VTERTTPARGRLAVAAVVLTLLPLVSSCFGPTADDQARAKLDAETSQGETLEKANLKRKREREEDANAVRYLYLYSYGQPMGYYITKGKISSSGSQRTPEQDIHYTCSSSGSTCTHVVVDGPKDDGSFGAGDPGIFFFLADGTMIETNFDYLQADRPITGVNVPLLGGTA
jgi:hypothetical protein